MAFTPDLLLPEIHKLTMSVFESLYREDKDHVNTPELDGECKWEDDDIVLIQDAACAATNAISKVWPNSTVHLRWYEPDEYKTLTPEQKDELREWREHTGLGGNGRTGLRWIQEI